MVVPGHKMYWIFIFHQIGTETINKNKDISKKDKYTRVEYTTMGVASGSVLPFRHNPSLEGKIFSDAHPKVEKTSEKISSMVQYAWVGLY